MSEYDHDESDQVTEKAALQVDVYGIKANIRPADTGDKPPTSWKDVWRKVNGHLMRLATELAGLAADIPAGARRLLRGITGIPNGIAERVSRSHEKADQAEEDRQLHQAARPQLPAPPRESADILETILSKYQAQGLSPVIRKLDDGSILIAIVRSEHQQLATELAKYLQLPAPPPAPDRDEDPAQPG